MKSSIKAQSLLEYILLIGIVSLVLISMGPLIRRTMQSIIKTTSDQLAPQNEAEQSLDGSGYLVNSFSTVKSSTNKIYREIGSYVPQYIYQGKTDTTVDTTTDLGVVGTTAE